MDNDPKVMKEASHILNSECDVTETEPDGDSLWSSGSVGVSEAGTDHSSMDSALRDLPTVRASKDEREDEIERLILAAEALVVERARLGIPTTTTSIAPKGGPLAGKVRAATITTLVHHKEAFSDNKCGAENSGYFTDLDNAGQASHTSSSLSGKKSIHMNIYCEADQHSVQSRETLSSTPCDSLILSKVSDSSLKDCDSLVPSTVMPADHPASVPRLSLEPTREPEGGWAVGVPEERVAINKVEKEACNSSIRGSSWGAGVSLKEQQAVAQGSHSPLPPQAGVACGEAASVAVHEEGSCLLSLALSATTSLRRLTRLLRQVGALQLGTDTPRLCESVLHELTQHEAHQQGLETKLTAAATNLQTAVVQVRGLEGQWQEQCQQAQVWHAAALALLQQLEAGLEGCGLNHMLAVTSPRRRYSPRVLEDVGSAVALLTGELSRRLQRLTRAEEEVAHLREELQGVREVLTHRDSRTRLSEAEARQGRQQSQEDLAALRQCLSQAENNLTEAQLENTRLSEEAKRQACENSAAFAAVQKKLHEVQHKAETRSSELERELHLSGKEKQRLEASVGELKEHLTLRTQQVHLVEDENSQLVESLRLALRQQQAEVEQLRHHLEAGNAERSHLSQSHNELKQEAAAREEELDEAKVKSEQLNRRVTELEAEQKQTQTDLQHKIDRLSSERNDLEAKVRAQEFVIMQLRTELEMEKVQTRTLSEEATVLGKKARDLQERLWTQAKRWRSNSVASIDTLDHHQQQQGQRLGMGLSSARGSSTSLVHTDEAPPLGGLKHQVAGEGEGGLAREERLQALLREKDAELQGLHHSLSTQIINKNQELDLLTNKLGGLEEQLCTLVSGLEASAAIGDITTEVGQMLQERTQNLDSLQESSKWLQCELSSLALENQSLNKELVVSRMSEKDSLQDAQGSARQARQEAREERIATARLREECSRLQAQLDQMQHTLQQERQERKISAVVHGVKHREFSSLLESATTALNHYQT